MTPRAPASAPPAGPATPPRHRRARVARRPSASASPARAAAPAAKARTRCWAMSPGASRPASSATRADAGAARPAANRRRTAAAAADQARGDASAALRRPPARRAGRPRRSPDPLPYGRDDRRRRRPAAMSAATVRLGAEGRPRDPARGQQALTLASGAGLDRRRGRARRPRLRPARRGPRSAAGHTFTSPRPQRQQLAVPPAAPPTAPPDRVPHGRLLAQVEQRRVGGDRGSAVEVVARRRRGRRRSSVCPPTGRRRQVAPASESRTLTRTRSDSRAR